MFYDTKVRALCAQLTLETNLAKCEELASELASTLAGRSPITKEELASILHGRRTIGHKEETPFTRVFSLERKKAG